VSVLGSCVNESPCLHGAPVFFSLSGRAGATALDAKAAGSLRGRLGTELGLISRAHERRTASYLLTAAGRVPSAALFCPGSGGSRCPGLFEEGM